MAARIQAGERAEGKKEFWGFVWQGAAAEALTCDRSGTLSPSERSGVDSGTEQLVRPLLEEHHDRIQALLDKNPTASRRELDPQIHTISNETHRKIHAPLTDHQKELEKPMRVGHGNGIAHQPCPRRIAWRRLRATSNSGPGATFQFTLPTEVPAHQSA